MRNARKLLGSALLVVLLLAGCGITVPTDPYGTLDRVNGGTLRVGATHNPPWVEVGSDDIPTGEEAALVERFARDHGATVEWSIGSEESLVGDLEHGEIDLLVGGFTDATPWTDRVAMTVPYTSDTDERGQTHKQVMLVRMGENRFLLTLESFLLEAGEDG